MAENRNVRGNHINPKSVSTGQAQITDDTTKIVTVPGDYATLDAAINVEAGNIRPSGAVTEILIESGHIVEQRAVASNGFYGNLRIKSEDNIVTVNNPGSDFDENVVLYGENAVMPVVSAVFDMGGEGEDGIYVNNHAMCKVTGAGGVINAGRNGIGVRRSSIANVTSADFSGASFAAVHARHAGLVTAQQVDGSGSSRGVLSSWGGHVDAYGADFSNCSGRSIMAEHGSTVTAANNVNLSGGARVDAQHSSSINIPGADLTGISDSFCIEAGPYCSVNADGADMSGYDGGFHAIRIQNGSRLNCRGAEINNPGSGNAVRARHGSQVNMQNADFGTLNVRLDNGSIMNANGATYGSANISPNTVTSDGILFE